MIREKDLTEPRPECFFSDRLCISSKLQTDLKNTGMFSTFLPRPGRACISPYDYSLLDNNEQEKKKKSS